MSDALETLATQIGVLLALFGAVKIIAMLH